MVKALGDKKNAYAIIQDRENEILDAWIHNTLSSHITETSSLLSEEDVRRQSARFFQVFKNSLPTDQEKENQAKILDDHTTQHLTEISRDWAQSGFKPSQTALFIFSL
ncbi:RsbRD N-terminal domain-containing protein, partial [Magnetococcales bacterium HHB-1]